MTLLGVTPTHSFLAAYICIRTVQMAVTILIPEGGLTNEKGGYLEPAGGPPGTFTPGGTILGNSKGG